MAVHFGAGNIGRGFVAQFLHESGYDVVFVDVLDRLVEQLSEQRHYLVHEIGAGAEDHIVDQYRALDGDDDPDAVVAAIASADLVTTAVGARALPLIAPVIGRGLDSRPEWATPIPVIACENALNATDLLATAIRQSVSGDNAIFANSAIDRIVPEQHPDAARDGGLDVTIESFYEWVIDRTPFHGHEPPIIGVTWVDDLQPFIERKLFTVNTGHAAAAYFGHARGFIGIREALATPELQAEVRAVLDETKTLLVEKHGFSEQRQQEYIERTMQRISNPQLPDTCQRVGRNPLRKLGRHERFIGPAAELAERGQPVWHLLTAVGAALRFDVAEDAESVELQGMLASGVPPEDLATQVTGIEAQHPLFASLVEVFRLRLADER